MRCQVSGVRCHVCFKRLIYIYCVYILIFFIPDGTRTRNFQIRSLARYPITSQGLIKKLITHIMLLLYQLYVFKLFLYLFFIYIILIFTYYSLKYNEQTTDWLELQYLKPLGVQKNLSCEIRTLFLEMAGGRRQKIETF